MGQKRYIFTLRLCVSLYAEADIKAPTLSYASRVYFSLRKSDVKNKLPGICLDGIQAYTLNYVELLLQLSYCWTPGFHSGNYKGF
jgi:hypothetical protein